MCTWILLHVSNETNQVLLLGLALTLAMFGLNCIALVPLQR
jgi:hypothetical protein